MSRVLRCAWATTFVFMLASAGPLSAGEGDMHDHDSHDHMPADSGMSDMSKKMGNMSEEMSDMFLVKQEIDGYDVSFHVMEARPGKEMGGTHDFMIKVEKDGSVVSNLVMNTRVVHPGGEAETKPAMKMGDWLMAGYDLGHDGRHQLMILFKTADGEKHQGGVYYPAK